MRSINRLALLETVASILMVALLLIFAVEAVAVYRVVAGRAPVPVAQTIATDHIQGGSR